MAKTMAESVPSPAQGPRIPTTTTSSIQSDASRGDVDMAPDSGVLFNPRYSSTRVKPSTAKATKKAKGIYSHDPLLDENIDELWRFLVSNLEQPHLAVHLVGTRIRQIGQIMCVETDFDFRIDVSKYVIPSWSRIVAHSSSSYKYCRSNEEGKPGPTLRETLEEYTTSKNPLKEFRLEKLVLWDYDRIKELIKHFVQSSGYQGGVRVEFPNRDYKVVALASNRSSKAAHSLVVRALCVVSCLCIVCWPAWCIGRERIDRLACEYGMAVSGDEFFSRNSAIIQSAVGQKRRGVFVAF